MIVKAESKFMKLTPSKVRQVMELIKGKDVTEAEAILLNINKRPKEHLIKILRSAVANAKVKGFLPNQLYVSRAICNSGPAWKRYKAAAFGRATEIRRRTAHIKIELDLKSGA